MRWIGGRESENVEDRRGAGGMTAGIGGIGAIVVVLVGLFFGIDPSMLLALLNGDQTTEQSDTRHPDDGSGSSRLPEGSREDPMRQFVSVVLADTEDVWTQVSRAWARLTMIRSSCSTPIG